MAEHLGGLVFTWDDVSELAVHQATDPDRTEDRRRGYAHGALVTRDEETGGDRLEVAVLGPTKRGWGTRGTHRGGRLENLSWARDAAALGFSDKTRASDAGIA